MRTVVVLPAPFGPSSANTSPPWTLRSTPSSTRVVPKALVRRSVSIVYAIHNECTPYTLIVARGLNVDLVVAAAMELADESGLEAVTMAAVAKRCGFTTMSLYRHVSGKDELMRRMLDAALGTAPELSSADCGQAWRSGRGRCSTSSTGTRGGSTSRSPA